MSFEKVGLFSRGQYRVSLPPIMGIMCLQNVPFVHISAGVLITPVGEPSQHQTLNPTLIKVRHVNMLKYFRWTESVLSSSAEYTGALS